MHLLVSEQYIESIMHGATTKVIKSPYYSREDEASLNKLRNKHAQWREALNVIFFFILRNSDEKVTWKANFFFRSSEDIRTASFILQHFYVLHAATHFVTWGKINNFFFQATLKEGTGYWPTFPCRDWKFWETKILIHKESA